MTSIVEEKLKQLPRHLHEDVIDFIDFLLVKKVLKKKKRPKLDWVGAAISG